MGKRTSIHGYKLSKDELNKLIDDATIDAHDEEEQLSGFWTMFESQLKLPFSTMVFGKVVTAEDIVSMTTLGDGNPPAPERAS